MIFWVHNILNVGTIIIDFIVFFILKLACWKSLYVIDPYISDQMYGSTHLFNGSSATLPSNVLIHQKRITLFLSYLWSSNLSYTIRGRYNDPLINIFYTNREFLEMKNQQNYH